MSNLNIRCWLETDALFKDTGKNTGSMNKCKLPTASRITNSQLETTTPFLSRLEIFPEKYLLQKTNANSNNSVS